MVGNGDFPDNLPELLSAADEQWAIDRV